MTVIPPVLMPAVVFSSPWLLWGLLLAVVPLAIQLFFRPRYRDEHWGAMQFLDAALRQQRQRMQLEQWLQLLLRTLLIVALVLALAQPVPEERSQSVPTDSGVHWILVWDSSLSMRATAGTESAFERGRSRLLDLVDRAPYGSSFRLVRPSSHHDRLLIAQPLFDPDALRLELELLQPTYDDNNWPAALRDVLTLLPTSPANQIEVVMVSDFQHRDWSPKGRQRDQLAQLLQELDRQAGITLLDVGTPVENCSLTQIETAPQQSEGPIHNDISVRVANRGDHLATVDVDLLIDDAPYGRETLSVPAGEERSHTFSVSLFEPGDHIVTARIPDDALSADNQLSVILPIASAHRLLIVQNPSMLARRQAAEYLQLVFPESPRGIGINSSKRHSQFEVDIVSISELATRPLDSYAAIFLCNVGELSSDALVRLERFVTLGGGVVISPGERTLQSEPGRRLLESSLIGATHIERVSPRNEDSPPHLFRPRRPDHPLIVAFRDRPEAGVSTTRVYEYLKLHFDLPDVWETVVEYDTGDPALLTRSLGRGRIVLLTTALDDSWSSWPLWPSFVPMLRELEQYVSAGRLQRAQLLIGDTWTFPAVPGGAAMVGADGGEMENSNLQSSPTIVDPEQRSRPAETSSDATSWTYSQTRQPGIYTVTLPQQVERFAVNIDPREGATQRVSVDTLKEGLLRDLTIHTQLSGDAANQGTLNSGNEFQLVFYLLLVAGCLWIAELLLLQHTGLSVVLLVSTLEASLLMGPEAGLLRLATTIVILMVGQGVVLMLYQRHRQSLAKD